MNIVIRHEKPEEYTAVEQSTREAFWNLYCPGCSEHLIVHQLRSHPDFIPELSFVIELDGEVVGSIFYSHSRVVDGAGYEHKTITFGPVSILPRLHRKGLGRALITHSINAARTLGYGAIVICGYPHHYAPYGFQGAKKFGIAMPDEKYYTGLMALPLFEGALAGASGCIQFSEAMEVGEVEAFDRQFPQKTKAVMSSQAEFEKAVTEVDERDF